MPRQGLQAARVEGFAGPVRGDGALPDRIAPFDLILPPRVRFGRGDMTASVPEILGFGQRFVLVHGRAPGRAAPLAEALEAAGAALHREACAGEPEPGTLIAALDRTRDSEPDAVIALDLGKAQAALLPASDPDPMEHLEVLGRGRPLLAAPLPVVAVPATAGTGSETTRNAVIGVPEHRRKVSLRDPRMMARLAVIDPSLPDGTPRDVTISSGLDAVTQVIEPYLSSRANPFTDALCRDGVPRGLSALARLAKQEDPAARDDLALVAWLSSIALANAGLGAVHGIAGVLGGETGAAHGMICGQSLALSCAPAGQRQRLARRRPRASTPWRRAAAIRSAAISTGSGNGRGRTARPLRRSGCPRTPRARSRTGRPPVPR